MEECARQGLLYILGSFFFFRILCEISNWLCSTLQWPQLNSNKMAVWNNTVISWAHALISAVLSVYCFTSNPVIFSDLVTGSHLSHLIVCISTGYFLHDTADMLLKRLFFDSISIWVHHAIVIICFGAAVVNCQLSAYLAWSLVVEVNGVFLHLRRLLSMAGIPDDAAAYKLNWFVLMSTFYLIRIGAHAALLVKVYWDFPIFPSSFSFIVAFTGMIMMNLYNFVLLNGLIQGERRKAQKIKEKGN